MAIDQEVLGILVRLEGKTAFIAGVREEQGAIKGYSASLNEAAAAGDRAAASNKRIASGGALIGKTMKVGGLLFAAGMVEAVKHSLEFNRQLTLLETQAGATSAEVSNARKKLLDWKDVTQTPTELAMGLFHLQSIGLKGAHALDALHIAAQGATVGNANLEETATALGAAWLSQIKGGGNLNEVMATMNATVGQGNIRMNELVEALGTGILPTAKLAGLSLQDIMAALAVLKDEGYPASSAMAQLATALHFLYAPTKKAQDAMAGIGLTQEQVVMAMKGPDGLHNALKLLREHLKGVGGEAERLKVLGEIFPGGRGRVLLVLMNQLDRLEEKQKNIGKASGPQFEQAVKKTMEEPAVRIKNAWANFLKQMVKVGDELEGPAASAMEVVLKVGMGLLTVIMALTDEGKLLVPLIGIMAGAWLIYKGAVIGAAIAQAGWNAAVIVGNVLLGILDGELVTAAAAFAALDLAVAGPIIAIIAGFIAIGLIIYHFRNQIADAAKWVWKIWKPVAMIIISPFRKLGEVAVKNFKTVLGWAGKLLHFITPWAKTVGQELASPFEWMWKQAKWVFDHIKKLAHPHAGGLDLGGLWGGAKAGLGSLPTVGPFFSSILGHAHGGVMPYSGYTTVNENSAGETIWLPQGSKIDPSPADSPSKPRHHVPNPAADPSWDKLPQLEATLVLPNGETLADLVVVNLKKKKQRL